MATTVASLNAVLSLSSKAFESGMNRARKTSRRFGKSIRNVSRVVTRFGGKLTAIAGIGGVAGIGFLIRREMQALDAIAKVSDKLGIQTDKLIGLQYAARIAGVPIRTMNMALQRFTRRLAEAAVGTGEAQAVIKELGIDAKALSTERLTEQFLATGDAMMKTATAGEWVRRGFKLLDSEGVAVINVWKMGRQAIEAYIKEAKLLGFAFTRGELRMIERANDAITRTGLIIRGVIGKTVIAIAPIIEKISTKLGDAVAKLTGSDFVAKVQGFILSVADGFGKILDILRIEMPQAISSLGRIALGAMKMFPGADQDALDRYIRSLELLGRELEDKQRYGSVYTFGVGTAPGLFVRQLRTLFAQAASGGGKGIFGSMFTDIAQGVGAAAASGTQLASARALGIVGGAPRFGAAGQQSGMPRDMRTTAQNTSEMKRDLAQFLNLFRRNAPALQAVLRVGP